MAAGTAIVASSLDGYRNVATDGGDALLVEPGDAPALAKALAEVLANPRRRAQLVAAGEERADDFSMTTLARIYAAHYERRAHARRDERRPNRRVSALVTRIVTSWLSSGSSSASSSS